MPIILFLLFGLGTAFAVYAVTAKALRTRHASDGPGPIARALQGRNRLFMAVLLFVLAVLATVEAFVPPFHSLLLDLQYATSSDPFWVQTFGSGAGISWAVYGFVLLGTALGLYGGTLLACQRSPGVAKSVRGSQLV